MISLRERLYWFLFDLRQGQASIQAMGLGFPFQFYRAKAIRGEYSDTNQAKQYDIAITRADVKPGERYYRAILVWHLGPGENGFNHHLYGDMVDSAGQRIKLARLIVWNNNLPPYVMTLDKPDEEPATNGPMYWGDTLAVAVDPVWSGGLKSDRVSGFHTRWPDESSDVRQGHHSYYVVFQETISGEEPPPVEPPPPTEITLEQRVTDLESRVDILEKQAWKV